MGPIQAMPLACRESMNPLFDDDHKRRSRRHDMQPESTLLSVAGIPDVQVVVKGNEPASSKQASSDGSA